MAAEFRTQNAASSLRVEHLEFPPAEFLENDPEDSRFYAAFQNAKIPLFPTGYFAVWSGDARVSVIPYFLMEFSINTMLPEGRLKRALAWCKLKVAFVGHPCVDLGRIDGTVSKEVLEAVNEKLFKKASILAYKGFGAHLPLPGFTRAEGLPVAVCWCVTWGWTMNDPELTASISCYGSKPFKSASATGSRSSTPEPLVTTSNIKWVATWFLPGTISATKIQS